MCTFCRSNLCISLNNGERRQNAKHSPGEEFLGIKTFVTFELKGNMKIKLQILDHKNMLNLTVKSDFEKVF